VLLRLVLVHPVPLASRVYHHTNHTVLPASEPADDDDDHPPEDEPPPIPDEPLPDSDQSDDEDTVRSLYLRVYVCVCACASLAACFRMN
jgi:hypothetical protein